MLSLDFCVLQNGELLCKYEVVIAKQPIKVRASVCTVACCNVMVNAKRQAQSIQLLEQALTSCKFLQYNTATYLLGKNASQRRSQQCMPDKNI